MIANLQYILENIRFEYNNFRREDKIVEYKNNPCILTLAHNGKSDKNHIIDFTKKVNFEIKNKNTSDMSLMVEQSGTERNMFFWDLGKLLCIPGFECEHYGPEEKDYQYMNKLHSAFKEFYNTCPADHS